MAATLKPFRANDEKEPKFVAAALPTLAVQGDWRDTFFSEAYDAAPLGDVLYTLDRHPMAHGVLTPEIFRTCFWAINQIFTRPGTFEFYLTVFRAIWGDAVAIEFTNSTPGILGINISGIEGATSNLIFREIVSDVYVHSNWVDEDGDQLLAQVTTGTKNQSEVDALINEISPVGVLVTATLII